MAASTRAKSSESAYLKLTGIVVALIGLLVAVAAVIWENEVTGQPGAHSPYVKLATDLLALVGMTVFTMGALTILLETKSWKTYFENGLKDVVVKQDYLSKLSDEELRTLQMNSLKAFYRGDNLEREGSFLLYCGQKIHRYIGLPYREDVQDEIVVEEYDSAANVAKVYEKLVYVCRKAGERGLIQPEVKWSPDEDEYLNNPAPVCKLSLKYPEGHEKAGHEITEELKGPDFQLSLTGKGLDTVDGLVVTMELWYSVEPARLQNWYMGYPTKNFTLVIKYPEELTIQLKEFVSYPDLVQRTPKKGYFSLSYNMWLLPHQNGVAWHFLKSQPAIVSAKPTLPPRAADEPPLPPKASPSTPRELVGSQA